MRYRLNTQEVAQEEIEGEVIVVHLTTGFYYSLQGSAADIWSGVVHRASEDALVAAVAARWSGDPDVIGDSVRAFLDELLAEGLIVPDESGEGAAPVPDRGRDGGAFQPPMLHRYTDMQELLLVDPIHEVEDAGWPKKERRRAP